MQLVAVVHEPVTVVPLQSVLCSDPDISSLVLADIAYIVIDQPVALGDMPEEIFIVLPRSGYARDSKKYS
jgi:hypothetical protein